ncbi:MAG: hypothetical protein ACLFS4_04275 [Opitutales bacterium]
MGDIDFGRIELQHRRNDEGQGSDSVISSWHVPFLFTYAAPEGRKHLNWIRPGGSVERFENKQIEKRAPDHLVETWTAVSDGTAGNYQFFGRDGTIYTYEQGQIRSLELPDGREFQFDTDGPRITQIRQRGANVPLIKADYDSAGQLTDLLIGEIRHRFSYSRNRLTAKGRPGQKQMEIKGHPQNASGTFGVL